MSDIAALQKELDEVVAANNAQAEVVRKVKADGASKTEARNLLTPSMPLITIL